MSHTDSYHGVFTHTGVHIPTLLTCS